MSSRHSKVFTASYFAGLEQAVEDPRHNPADVMPTAHVFFLFFFIYLIFFSNLYGNNHTIYRRFLQFGAVIPRRFRRVVIFEFLVFILFPSLVAIAGSVLVAHVSFALAAPYHFDFVSSSLAVFALQVHAFALDAIVFTTPLQNLVPGPDLDILRVPWQMSERQTVARTHHFCDGFD